MNTYESDTVNLVEALQDNDNLRYHNFKLQSALEDCLKILNIHESGELLTAEEKVLLSTSKDVIVKGYNILELSK